MSQLKDRLERDLREIAAGAHPSPSAWESIVARLDDDEGSEVALVPARDPDRSKRPVWIAVAAAALVVITGSIAVLVIGAGDDHSISTVDSDPTTNPSVSTSGGWWPQSTLNEVRAAQEAADAGDPAYTWQLDANLAADEEPWGAEIFTRFIEEELGWEEFTGAPFAGYVYGDRGGDIANVLFIRCAPGQTNPLNHLYADAPPEIRGCAPTIDDHTYETVSFGVHQPGRRGPSAIWVVDRWEILQSQPDPLGPFGLVSPDFSQRQVEQVVPPSDDDVTAFLQAFLRARVDGQGAEQYLLPAPPRFEAVPLLYATTSGLPYERSEIQRLQGPVWPNGWTEYKVRLVAEDETVVEQRFHVVRHDGQLGLQYGYAENDVRTTENGESVAVPHSVLGDTMTFTAPPLVPRGDGVIETQTARSDGRVIIADDPHPDSCEDGPAPADAEALARSIMAVPGFETTEPVPVPIAGTDGLQMDVTFSERDCDSLWMRSLPAGAPGWRMRLYLIDYPDESASPSGSWRPQVLTIAVIAPETDFEQVLEQAMPIVESLEFHPG